MLLSTFVLPPLPSQTQDHPPPLPPCKAISLWHCRSWERGAAAAATWPNERFLYSSFATCGFSKWASRLQQQRWQEQQQHYVG